jgi:hypothetical protein
MDEKQINTVEITTSIGLPFVFEISEKEDLTPFIVDIWLGGTECVTDTIMPYINCKTDLYKSIIMAYENRRKKDEQLLNRELLNT